MDIITIGAQTNFQNGNFSKEREIGFKAQEVREILPEIVDEMPDGYLAVDYSKVVPVLVEAINDLQELVQQQQQDIEEIQGKLDKRNLKKDK